uniref:Chitin-binding type-2 domain-containing protein n=1 Tax=Timema douglasi TaxID=61478 RepID=A0A7R8Z9I2_TIMDO|nr:unnamed protein product [Timema douglasi]
MTMSTGRILDSSVFIDLETEARQDGPGEGPATKNESDRNPPASETFRCPGVGKYGDPSDCTQFRDCRREMYWLSDRIIECRPHFGFSASKQACVPVFFSDCYPDNSRQWVDGRKGMHENMRKFRKSWSDSTERK